MNEKFAPHTDENYFSFWKPRLHIQEFLKKTEIDLTPEELSIQLGMTEDKVHKILKIAKEPLSLETPIEDDEDSQLGNFVEDFSTMPTVDKRILNDPNLKVQVENIINQLPTRNKM